MATRRNNATSNNNGNTSSSTVKSHYVSKDKEIIKVRLGEREMEIRRVWDSKKKALKEELIQISNDNPDVLTRNALIISACLDAVGLKWADAPTKEVGRVTWKEGADEYESPKIKIKYLMNGGQFRVVRNSDGTQKIELDVVTEQTVVQCIKDAQDWSEDDQSALENHRAALQRRRLDRQRHEQYERQCVHTFSCEELFASAGL